MEQNAIAVIDDLICRKHASKEGVPIVGTLALLKLALD
jgi:predicted nucleic acid-binding protein